MRNKDIYGPLDYVSSRKNIKYLNRIERFQFSIVPDLPGQDLKLSRDARALL